MPSEKLASAENLFKGNLASAWNILEGSSGDYTDLGIARRFGGSAAAYSLRDIGAMNGRVVKVRRDVDGDGTDKEEDFSANQVQSGALEDWVNGKLESTLPADVATAAAAYSLRKVKADYSGEAVRIRRSSDSVEVEVAFDSDGKVSASSAITNVAEQGGESGSTTATTLGDFLTEDINIFTDSSSQSWANIRSTDSFETSTALGGEVNYRKFTPNSGVGTSALFGITSFFDVSASSTYTISGQVYVPSGQTTVNAFKIVNGTSGSSPSLSGATNTVPATDQWVDFSFTSAIPIATQFYINAAKDQNAFFSPNGSDFIAFKDITVTATDSGATVHTWYDQAGSNNAVQETAVNQPKIAENGALLADGLDFDGTDDFLESTTLTSIYTGTDTVSSAFVVVNSDVASTTQYIIGAGNTTLSNPMYNTLFHSGGNIGWQARDDSGTLKSNLSATPYEANKMYLVSNINSGTTTDFNKNSVIEDNGADSDLGAKTINTVKLGARGNAASSPLNGSIKEAIFYATDQSDNRFKIESNINNYYGLYNDANEFASNETAFRFLNERSGGTSASSDLTQFTLDVQTASAYVGAKFSSNVLSGDSIYVSFNCTFDNGSPSPKIALRDVDTVLNGGIDSNEENVTEGFNQFTLTSNSSDASGIVWSEGDDNVIFSVTDLKISRIARNGFVETWYDQSGNGNDATQGTAGNQPSIVLNGGINTDGLNFDGSDDVLVSTSFSATQPITTSAVFKSSNTSDSQTVIGGISFNYIIHRAGGAATAGLNAGTLLAPFSSITSKQLMTTLASGTSSTVAQNGVISSTGDAGTNNQTDLGIGSNGNGGTAGSGSAKFDGNIEEVIIFDADKTSDRTEIERDIANFYNITLS